MSHFTVLVIGENPEEQLAPFQENNMEDCPKEFLEFVDREDEFKEEYESGTRNMVVMPNGEFLAPYDDRFRVGGSLGIGTGTHKVPKKYEQREVPFKELYKTFGEFVKDYHGYSKRDPKKKRYGYWENPNAKWDWYQLGGRWRGMFKMKQSAKQAAVVGAPGVPEIMAREAGREVPDIPDDRTDQAYKRDIDFEGMYNEAADKAAEFYDEVAELFGGTIPKPSKTWAQYMGEAKNDKERSQVRKKYWNQKALKELTKLRKRKNLTDKQKGMINAWGFSLDDFVDGRESYIGHCMDSAIGTYAVIKDGEWYERGQMGWFGVGHNEKDPNAWNREFRKLLESVSDDTLLSVYDCHI